ncbi:Coiled-coil domain-containing protein 25 [Toxocara canis]|uniref:Coiled-coil domain-containing protein 25 n=1 Tax=Toxocara canis TaxID=6265 RepID=A0A0B2VMD7_TOXCA|nr:Coiled-coil domain-containing protein 25 [Toxocara canis]
MVIKFTSNVVDPPVMLYMGVDKYENEDLIRWGWPEDVWFHVDKVSSAHVYVRLPEGQTIDDMSEALVEDCAQLVKANSIQGNKMSNIDVVYTPWENLKKTGDMAVGQIGFKDDKKVKKVRVAKRVNEIVNRLNKTERKEDIDYRAEREERDAKERQKTRHKQREEKEREQAELEEKERQRRIRSYEGVFTEDRMHSNYDGGNDSDDFM